MSAPRRVREMVLGQVRTLSELHGIDEDLGLMAG